MMQLKPSYLFVGCLLFCISIYNVHAQSNPGTMPTDTLFVCDTTGVLFVQNNNDEQIQAGDALNYVITNAEGRLGVIFASSTDGVFSWSELLQDLAFSESNCDEFFVRAITGRADAAGLVDVNDASLSASNASRLVVFGVGIPLENEAATVVALELAAGTTEFTPIDAPCWGMQANNTREKSTACAYPCPCIDTLYVTSIDTTWYIATTDTTYLQTIGDTIFRTLLEAPDYALASEHIDTIIFDNIHDASAGFRIQNGAHLINPTSFEIYFDIVYGFNPDLPVIDTILEEKCGAAVLCPPILVTVGYGGGGVCPDVEAPILQEEIVVCSADSVRIDTLFLQSIATGCDSLIQINKYVFKPNFIYRSFIIDSLACEGDSILLTAAAGDTYLWEHGANSQSIQAGAGYHRVSITSGCDITIQSGTIATYPLPAYSLIKTPACEPFLQVYSLQISLSAAREIETNAGVMKWLDDILEVSNIPVSIPFEFTLTSPEGCVANYQIAAPVCELPTIAAPIGADIGICFDATTQVIAASVSDSSMTVDWYDTPSGGEALALGETSYLPKEPGIYYAETRHIASGLLSAKRTPVQLYIFAPPNLIVQDSSLTHCRTAEGSLSLSVEGDYAPYSFLWENNMVTAQRNELAVGIYPITISDANGCTYIDSVVVRNDPTLCDEIYLPNAFSPNGDDINDLFSIQVPYDFSKPILVQIFDRTGRLLFETTDGVNNAWDGTFLGQPMRPSVYMCVAIVTREGGKQYKYITDVALIR